MPLIGTTIIITTRVSWSLQQLLQSPEKEIAPVISLNNKAAQLKVKVDIKVSKKKRCTARKYQEIFDKFPPIIFSLVSTEECQHESVLQEASDRS